MLDSQEQIQEQKSHQVEKQERHSVCFPVHLLIGFHPGKAKEKPFQRCKDWRQDYTFPLIDARHVQAEWLDQHQEDDDISRKLEPARPGSSEPLRFNKRNEQVNEQPDHDKPSQEENGIHHHFSISQVAQAQKSPHSQGKN